MIIFLAALQIAHATDYYGKFIIFYFVSYLCFDCSIPVIYIYFNNILYLFIYYCYYYYLLRLLYHRFFFKVTISHLRTNLLFPISYRFFSTLYFLYFSLFIAFTTYSLFMHLIIYVSLEKLYIITTTTTTNHITSYRLHIHTHSRDIHAE